MSESRAGAPAKVCIACGQDCSNRPRTKDPRGRYACRACLDARQAAAPPKPVAMPELEPVDDRIPTDLLALEAAAKPGAGPQVCPNCQSSMPHGAPICVQCGFDSRNGQVIATQESVDNIRPTREKGKCPECGYSLKGLKSTRCPECGTIMARMTDREKAREDSVRVVRWAYLKPVLQFAIGSLVIACYYGSKHETDVVVRYFLTYIITVPIGVLGYFLCCVLWMGFDAPMHLTALRLAGVYALVDMVYVLVGIGPGVMMVGLLPLALYGALLAESLDLELQDAIIVGLVTFLIKFGAMLAIAAFILNH